MGLCLDRARSGEGPVLEGALFWRSLFRRESVLDEPILDGASSWEPTLEEPS